MKRFTIASLPLVLILLLLVVSFLRQPLALVDSGPFLTMGTYARIQLYCEDERLGHRAIQAAQESLTDVDRLMSTYREDSEISRVNRRADQKPVLISRETFDLIKKSLRFSRLTEGAFDITVNPLLMVWQKAAEEKRLAAVEQITKARRISGYQKLILSGPDQSQVFFQVTGMQLNVDAIAKGYGVDRALAAVRRKGVYAGLVEIGGEIACFGSPDNKTGNWIIGIQDPFVDGHDEITSKRTLCPLYLKNCAVATSGNYRRYRLINGRKYSHIVDPRTGQPAEKLPSVTIIAPNAADADALATSVSVMGPKKGLALIESIPDTEALLITGTRDRHRIIRSSGFHRYESKIETKAKEVVSGRD